MSEATGDRSRESRPRVPWILLGSVLLIAATARIAHLSATSRYPLGGVLVQDARHYHDEALRILSGSPAAGGAGPSFMNLGYPWFLAAVYAAAGRAPQAAAVVQAALGAATAVMLALTAFLLFRSRSVALLSGALYAGYGGALFYEGVLLTPALTNALLAAALLGLAFRARGRSRILTAVSGICVGLAVLVRPNTILILPLLAAPVWAVRSGSREPGHRARALAGTVLFLACSTAVFAPVIVRNGLAHDQWLPVSANGGMNFWLGNNPRAEGVYFVAEFLERTDAVGEREGFLEEARRRSGDATLDLAGSSRFWFVEGLREIRADPGRWLHVLGRKIALCWNHREAKTNIGLPFHRRFSPVLAWASLPFGPLAVLGIAGLVQLVASRRLREAWLIGAPLLMALITCTIFFVSGEYRHPASLGLCLTAAVFLAGPVGGLRRVLGRRSGARPTRLGLIGEPTPRLALISLPPALLLVFLPFPALDSILDPGLDFANHAKALIRPGSDGVPPDAAAFRQALDLLSRAGPSMERNLYVMEGAFAVLHRQALALNDAAAAERAFGVARRLLARELRPPQRGYPDRFLVLLRDSIGPRIAELARTECVRSRPGLRREAALLGGNGYAEIAELIDRREYLEALTFAREALRRDPHHPLLQAQMGRILMATGDETGGLVWLRRGLLGWPEIPEPAFALGEYFASRGEGEKARVALEETLRRDPTYPGARRLLERLAETGGAGRRR